jgi:hypothetical protein
MVRIHASHTRSSPTPWLADHRSHQAAAHGSRSIQDRACRLQGKDAASRKPAPAQERPGTPINPDGDYMDCWLRVGMALHHATAGSGEAYRALGRLESAEGNSYRGRRDRDQVGLLRATTPAAPATLGTVFFLAREAGWDWADSPSRHLIGRRQGQNCNAGTRRQPCLADPKAHSSPRPPTRSLSASSKTMTTLVNTKQCTHRPQAGQLDWFASARSTKLVGRRTADEWRSLRRLACLPALADLAAEHVCDLWHDQRRHRLREHDAAYGPG